MIWKKQPTETQIAALNSNLVVRSLENLSSYTAQTLIDTALNAGHKILITSCTGGNRISDLPEVTAGTYVVIPNSYYIKLIVFGVNGKIYMYDGNSWQTNGA